MRCALESEKPVFPSESGMDDLHLVSPLWQRSSCEAWLARRAAAAAPAAGESELLFALICDCEPGSVNGFMVEQVMPVVSPDLRKELGSCCVRKRLGLHSALSARSEFVRYVGVRANLSPFVPLPDVEHLVEALTEVVAQLEAARRLRREALHGALRPSCVLGIGQGVGARPVVADGGWMRLGEKSLLAPEGEAFLAPELARGSLLLATDVWGVARLASAWAAQLAMHSWLCEKRWVLEECLADNPAARPESLLKALEEFGGDPKEAVRRAELYAQSTEADEAALACSAKGALYAESELSKAALLAHGEFSPAASAIAGEGGDWQDGHEDDSPREVECNLDVGSDDQERPFLRLGAEINAGALSDKAPRATWNLGSVSGLPIGVRFRVLPAPQLALVRSQGAGYPIVYVDPDGTGAYYLELDAMLKCTLPILVTLAILRLVECKADLQESFEPEGAVYPQGNNHLQWRKALLPEGVVQFLPDRFLAPVAMKAQLRLKVAGRRTMLDSPEETMLFVPRPTVRPRAQHLVDNVVVWQLHTGKEFEFALEVTPSVEELIPTLEPDILGDIVYHQCRARRDPMGKGRFWTVCVQADAPPESQGTLRLCLKLRWRAGERMMEVERTIERIQVEGTDQTGPCETVAAVDYGATNTCIAYWRPNPRHPEQRREPRYWNPADSREAQPDMPTAVYYEWHDKKFHERYGSEAWKNLLLDRENAFPSLKPQLATSRSAKRLYPPEGVALPVTKQAEEIVLEHTQAMLKDLRLALGNRSPKYLVLTHPTRMPLLQRAAFRGIGRRLAQFLGEGCQVIQVDEATSVAVAVARRIRSEQWDGRMRILVLDIGGSTSDLACVHVDAASQPPFRVVQRAGFPSFGGNFVTVALMHRLIELLRQNDPELQLQDFPVYDRTGVVDMTRHAAFPPFYLESGLRLVGNEDQVWGQYPEPFQQQMIRINGRVLFEFCEAIKVQGAIPQSLAHDDKLSFLGKRRVESARILETAQQANLSTESIAEFLFPRLEGITRSLEAMLESSSQEKLPSYLVLAGKSSRLALFQKYFADWAHAKGIELFDIPSERPSATVPFTRKSVVAAGAYDLGWLMSKSRRLYQSLLDDVHLAFPVGVRIPDPLDPHEDRMFVCLLNLPCTTITQAEACELENDPWTPPSRLDAAYILHHEECMPDVIRLAEQLPDSSSGLICARSVEPPELVGKPGEWYAWFDKDFQPHMGFRGGPSEAGL